MPIIQKVLVHWLNKRIKIEFNWHERNFMAEIYSQPTIFIYQQQQEIEKRLRSVTFLEFFYLTVNTSKDIFIRGSCLEAFCKRLKHATLLKKRLQHKCFPVNYAKFLTTPFSQNTSRRLLLSDSPNSDYY